jgi:endonuclease/exonuclease/phosphatase family metal-dependent hydrolase
VPDLSLASFNTHYGFLPYLSRARIPYDVEAALRTLDAEVIVIQELWRPDRRRGVVDDAADAMGLTVHYEETGPATGHGRWPHLARSGEGTVGVAVVTALPVRRRATIPLGPTPNDPAPGRTALHVEVDVQGDALQLVALHLTSRLPHGPPQQLRRLARAVPREGPAVIAGDCNFWGPGVRAFLRGWRRAVRGRTWPARHPHSQIDHILVRPVIEVVEGEVLPNVGSDHRPIRARLSW